MGLNNVSHATMRHARSGGVTVFVDQAAKNVCSPDHASLAGWMRNVSGGRRSLLESAMRAVSVVVGLVLGQHSGKLPLVGDQHAVQALTTDRADPPLGIGVGLGRTRRTAQHGDAGVSEHGVEGNGELGVAIADQERKPSICSPTAIMKLRACCVTHSPVGCR